MNEAREVSARREVKIGQSLAISFEVRGRQPPPKPALDILRRPKKAPNGYLVWAKRARPTNSGAGRVGRYKESP